MFLMTHKFGVAIAFVLTVAATVAAAMSGKLANVLIAAAMTTSILLGMAVILERMLERIANDSYDSGKASERRAIVRDLAEHLERKNAG